MSDRLTILGLGSLLSAASAGRTCARLANFRLVTVAGFCRVFNKTDSLLARTGRIPDKDNKYACLSAVPHEGGEAMIVSAFEIPFEDYPYFLQREFEYRLVRVAFKERGARLGGQGIMCLGDYADDRECEAVVHADPLRFERWQEFRARYAGAMWRRDLLPDQAYLDECLHITAQHGEDVYNNFIDTTYTGDGGTIRMYLEGSHRRAGQRAGH